MGIVTRHLLKSDAINHADSPISVIMATESRTMRSENDPTKLDIDLFKFKDTTLLV